MYNLKLTNIYLYSHHQTWLYALSPKIKIYSIILWLILNFYCPLIVFWLVVFTLILLNFYLRLFSKTFPSHNYYSISQFCLPNQILYILILFTLSYITSQYLLPSQITDIEINCKYPQYLLSINKPHIQQYISIDVLHRMFIPFFLFKQYITLTGFLYFCRLLKITTHEEELITAYLSLLRIRKHNNTKKLFFCFSVTKQYEHLILDKITNILYSLKLRNVNFHKLGIIYHSIHLITFYSEIFINKLLVYSQIISECLYSRELIYTKSQLSA